MSATLAPVRRAVELAELLGQPVPTAEQIAVIEAPLEPLLVVAGAGSGKTETMAARVVFLVANGLVAPEQVLGLTFTRKAAGQLSQRIRLRLSRLDGLRGEDPTTVVSAGQPRAARGGGDPRAGFAAGDGEPTVLTYHAFGGQLLRAFGPLVGIEPTARVLTPTSSWQLASSVVRRWDGDLDIELTPDLVTERLLQLAGVLADHLRSPAELQEITAELAATLEAAPRSLRQRKSLHSKLEPLHARLTNRHGILPLVGAYQDAKRRTRTVDFGDQMQRAAALVTAHHRVGQTVRDRYRVVLLDEYQDTGHAQRVILRGLFGSDSGGLGHPVTAVGDPCQSIYGWRGASASNLPRFRTDFPAAGGAPSERLSLLTSFRNPRGVLDLANAASASLRMAPVPVDRLRPRPDAPDGKLRFGLFDTVDDEDDWLADQIAATWSTSRTGGTAPPSTAVLVRRRSSIAGITERLTARGVPVDVPGLAGLLSEPEVVDVVSMLRLLVDPSAGAAAVRVLTGPRYRLGLADVAALGERARELTSTARRDGWQSATQSAAGIGPPAGRDAVHDALHSAVQDNIDAASLLDAIADPGAAERYSAAGYQRITRLGAELTGLRRRLSLPLTDLIVDIEHAIGLDVEVALAGPRGRASLDAFGEVVADFVSAGGGRSAPSDADDLTAMRSLQAGDLLAFLDVAAKREEGLELGEIEHRDDAVQVLTIHAAKGLEWEVVALPHLAADVFPSARSTTWMSDDSFLPPQLRGDAEDLPAFELPAGADQKELADAVEEHKAAWRTQHATEERRLLYVALTRAQHELLLSAHWWSRTTAKPRGPSEYLLELVAETPHAAVCWAEEPAAGATNPLTGTPVTAQWPVDPLSERRPAVEEGAQLVRYARHFGRPAGGGAPPLPGPPDPFGWQRDVDALVAERRRERVPDTTLWLPQTLTVSTIVALAHDRAELAQRLRRPLPLPPSPARRRGTGFHAWLERYFAGDALVDIDDLPGAHDEDAAPDADLDQLTAAFLSSAWAARVPREVELPFSMVIAEHPVQGRIDAVFADDDGWTVVDWKTGRPPTAEQLPALAVQLAVYRLAWAALAGVPPSQVRAAFHYVAVGQTIAPADLLDEGELTALIAGADGTAVPGVTQPVVTQPVIQPVGTAVRSRAHRSASADMAPFGT